MWLRTNGRSSNNAAIKGFIYTIGRIEPRFPSVGVEKEYHQAVGRTDSRGQTDFESMRKALSLPENRYLARKICWVLKVEGIETYLLIPRDPLDYSSLVDAIRAPPRATDVDVVIGIRGPIASPDTCNGLMVPIVIFDQIYSFDVDTLIKSVPKPAKTDTKKFLLTAEELFGRITQLIDNVGSTDEHRAINYLSVRYDAIYANVAEMYEQNFSLTSVEVRPSRLSGTRKIVDVIFVYRNRNTDVIEMYFVRVDVTEEFPFLVSKLLRTSITENIRQYQMDTLKQVRLQSLMAKSTGSNSIAVGIIDGPVDLNHEAFATSKIRTARGADIVACKTANSVACMHGTFVTGILTGKHGLHAPALCPACEIILRPIFSEESHGQELELPSSTPDELAEAIVECIQAGANIINLSIGLSTTSLTRLRQVEELMNLQSRKEYL